MTDDELAKTVRRMRRLALLMHCLSILGYIGFGFLLATLWFAYRFGLEGR